MGNNCVYCEKEEDESIVLCSECFSLAHRHTSKEVCNIIKNYIIDNGIEALTIELQKNWDSGILMNVQVSLKEDGKIYGY